MLLFMTHYTSFDSPHPAGHSGAQSLCGTMNLAYQPGSRQNCLRFPRWAKGKGMNHGALIYFVWYDLNSIMAKIWQKMNWGNFLLRFKLRLFSRGWATWRIACGAFAAQFHCAQAEEESANPTDIYLQWNEGLGEILSSWA